MKGYPVFSAVGLKEHPTADTYLPHLDARDDGGNPNVYWERTGRPGSHRRTAAVDGEAAAGSQGVGAGSGGVSSEVCVGKRFMGVSWG
jgi:hypothetical protein